MEKPAKNEQTIKCPETSLLKDAWRRLKKNKAAVFGMYIVFFMIFLAIFAPIIAPYNPIEVNYNKSQIAPCIKHPFGTDVLGRDILSRVIYGARISLLIGFLSQSIAIFLGITLGAFAGYYGGWIDKIILWVMNVVFAFPFLLLVLSIVATAENPNLYIVFLAIGFVSWVETARLVRGQFISVKEREFVEAARAIGETDFRIIFRHILPNVLAPVIVTTTLGIASAIMVEAGLSFLGCGAQPPTPSWGAMIEDGRHEIFEAWWIATIPGFAIMLTVFGFNLLGDGLRDALDPRMKR